MTEKVYIRPVVSYGGLGARLWLRSRAGFPKQFLCLTRTQSLLQQAAQRLKGLKPETIQVANADIMDQQGLFVGNPNYPIREDISALRTI
jgi:mannose-1-phosphate guanylyltransferase/mannose-6-phosphate isomerase